MKADGRTSGASSEALRLFAELAEELECAPTDPEAFFAAHPEHEVELRALYRGWREVDSLFRELAGESSIVRAALADLGSDAPVELSGGGARSVLGRLAGFARGGTGFAARYELGEELARGGMGIVRRVRDRVLGRDLALKVIRPVEPARRARVLRRFLEEAEVVGRLEHPGIVPIHELGLDDEGQVYFTMPLLRGRTLADVLALERTRAAGWTRARVLEVLLKVCDALAYAHARGIVHRDLKPANVMVGLFGEVYVMDWGLARALRATDGPGAESAAAASADPSSSEGREGPGALTLAGEIVGTPAYMAPEQAGGARAALDERCDVYALGAILHELLTGLRPYSAPGSELSNEATLTALEQGPPADPAGLAPDAPGELLAITRTAMAREPAARYASVRALADDLRAYLDGRVVRAHERGFFAEARKWVRRNRRLALALGLALLALAAAGVATVRSELKSAQVEREVRLRRRSELLADLAAIRGPETAAARAAPWSAAAMQHPVSDDAVEPEDLHEASALYLSTLERNGIVDLERDLGALFVDAGAADRHALLDELYWFELRLFAAEELASTPFEELAVTARLAALEQLIAHSEDRPGRVRLREAWKRARSGETSALDEFADDRNLEAASAEELEWLSVLLSSLGDDARLLRILERALELDPGRFWVHFRLATLTQGEERLLHAHAATTLDPRSSAAWFNVGCNYQNNAGPPFGDPEKAKRAYEKALELDPAAWAAALNLTYLVSVEEGVELMERAISAAPRGILYFRLAERLRTSHRCPDAIEVARRGVELFPEEAGIWEMLGECLGWLERWQEALLPLERALEIGAGSWPVRSNLFNVLTRLSAAEPDAARAHEINERVLRVASEAFELYPDEPKVVMNLAIAEYNLGRRSEGVELLIQSLEMGCADARATLEAARAELAAEGGFTTLVEEIDAALAP